MKKIALIPIDNRPVCYTLPQEISKIDDDLELLLPAREFLGDLKKSADIEAITNWIKNLESVDAIILSLDTIAYGGLITSRRTSDSLEKIQAKLEKFRDILKILKEKNAKIYAFSSIMRISNNNVNEEEKEYWNKYGKSIFEYSYNLHKSGNSDSNLPPQILEDYLVTRSRNFEINKMYLKWLDEGIFDTLVFSKDDCAQFGLNVMEAQELERINNEKKLSALIKTGADEIPLTLFARAVTNMNQAPKIAPIFLSPEHKNLISNYEDISIEKNVSSQIELAGGKISEENDADLILLINNFETKQGEIVMGIDTKQFVGDLILPQKPHIIADVRFANGADNAFISKLFENDLNFNNFYGYSAWNTSANTLGSLICAGIVRLFAKKYNEEAFKYLQLTRFLDDWAYQANIRQGLQKISTKPNANDTKQLMLDFELILQEKLKITADVHYSFPWERFFEVEINNDLH